MLNLDSSDGSVKPILGERDWGGFLIWFKLSSPINGLITLSMKYSLILFDPKSSPTGGYNSSNFNSKYPAKNAAASSSCLL